MTTTFDDIEIALPHPAHASGFLNAMIDAAEEYMQRSIVLFASGYQGGQPDMIEWLAGRDGLLSKKGRELEKDGAQKVEPGAGVMADGYQKNTDAIKKEAERLRQDNDNVDGASIATFNLSDQAYQDAKKVVDDLAAVLGGDHATIRWADGSLHLTAAAEHRLLGVILEAVDKVHDIIEKADAGMQRGAGDIYDRMPDLPQNPYGAAPDTGSRTPWVPAASNATWTKGDGTRDDIITLAEGELARGVFEQGGNNVAVYYDEDRVLRRAPYNINDAWCAAFSTWTWEEAGYKVNWTNPDYVPSIWNDAKHMGLAANVANAERGDMIIFDWQGDGTPDHVGIVRSVDPATGQIYTIEGNSSDRLRAPEGGYAANASSLVGVVKPPSDAPPGRD
ncbi:CHAP domain-containing protein [Nocardia sp. NPDC024068]|uniref:CHAP domain-containing protein n=1 Tax=Nocardia sp. NPDC024068 TaxID=3157197 RepID=UPI0033EB9994